MTIAVGMIARGGLVIAADTQITVGDAKVDQGKWRAIACSDPHEVDGKWHVSNVGSCVVAGAGQPADYLYSAAERVIETFQVDQSIVKKKDLHKAFEKTLRGFHDEHVVPYSGLPANERPSIELLIGYGRNGHSGLWGSNLGVLTPVPFYRAVGIAQAQASALLETLYRVPVLSLSATAMLASFVLYRIKASNIFCGNATDIVCLHSDMFQWIDRRKAQELEGLWERYSRTIEAANFRRLVGEPLDETQKADELLVALADFKVGLDQQLDAIRTRSAPPRLDSAKPPIPEHPKGAKKARPPSQA